MKVGGSHLTYCTNVHAGESWADVRANLERYTLAVKARVCPDEPFGVGLRLSHRAATELDVGELRAFLDEHGLYVFTINGFPYGPFHGTPVKEAVYRPDWLERERVTYTELLAGILTQLVPPGVTGTISTVPGCFHARGIDAVRISDNLWRCSDLGIVLALEPEPACIIETVADATRFFHDHLRDVPNLGICLDACHEAVLFQGMPVTDIPIAKLQLSCGLVVSPVDADARRELARFADDVYLHQTQSEHANYDDLPAALADPAPSDEWRIHFHVPIFRASLGPFSSTQPYLAELLAAHKQHAISPHLEVETYTWDVLPAEFRAEPIEDAIARELHWVLERLA